MSSYKDFLHCYNKKDVVSTLEAMQKMIDFYHNINIDLFELGCTFPIVVKICLHKFTDADFYPFIDGDEVCWKRSGKSWWADYPLCSRVKQSLTKPSSGKRLIFARQLLVVMRVNGIPTQCANLCQQDFTRIEILIRKLADLYTATEQDPHFWKNGHVLLPMYETWLKTWKIFIQRVDRKNRLLQRWWVLFSLKHCFWSYKMLLSVLLLSGSTTLPHWRRYPAWY